MNALLIFGRVGRDPEVRATQSGSKIASLSVALPEKRKDQSGNWIEETTWCKVKVFGSSANFVEQYVKKGDFVAVEGRFAVDSWEGKDGQKHFDTYCKASRIEKAWAPKAEQTQYNNPQNYGQKAADYSVPPPADDDLPF